MKKWIIISLTIFLLGCAALFGYLQRGEEQEPEVETVTLKWMIYGEKYQESDLIFQRFNEMLHQYLPEVNVEFEVVSKENYHKKWDMAMANNEALDIAWMGSEVLDFSEEVKKGSLLALDYLLKTYGQTLQETISEELWEKQRRDGNIYAIPVLGPLYRSNQVLVANANLMKRYGNFDEIIAVNQNHNYTVKECFDIMEPFLAAAKENNALGKGVSYQTLCTMADKGYEGLYGTSSPYVIRIFDQTPVVYNKYELESYRSCFETMAEWYQKGYIREDVAYLLDPTAEDGKISGNILFVEEYGEKDTVYDVNDIEYEALRGDLDGYRYISWETCRNCLVIPKTVKHPQEAMQVINLLNCEEGKELYRLLVNGTEKEQYIQVSEDSDVIARMTDDDRNYRYGLSPVNIGNIFLNYELCQGEFEQIEQYNEEALHSPLEGFELDTRMFAIEMARTELVVKKYKDILCQGISDDWETTYYEFLKEMKEAGSTKIVREMQKQVDQFIKK